MPMAVSLEQVAAGCNAVLSRDGAPADEQVDAAVLVEVPGDDAGAVVGNSRKCRGIARKMAVAVVDVEAILQRVILTRELVASADHVEIGMSVSVRVEEHGVHVLEQRVAAERRLVARLKRAVRPLEIQNARLPLGAAKIPAVKAVAVDVAAGNRGA